MNEPSLSREFWRRYYDLYPPAATEPSRAYLLGWWWRHEPDGVLWWALTRRAARRRANRSAREAHR